MITLWSKSSGIAETEAEKVMMCTDNSKFIEEEKSALIGRLLFTCP